MTTPEIIADRLRDLGVPQYMTLAGWCRREGLDYRATWRWMKNPRRSNTETTLKICAALGLRVEDVCGGQP